MTAVRLPELEITEIDLPLPTGFGLETKVGQAMLLFFQGSDVVAEGLVTAAVAHNAEPFQYPGGLVVILLQKVPDGLLEGIKQ